LHLRKFPVISKLRTNFADNARESLSTLGAASGIFKGDAVVRVSRPEEEAIEIGNSYRNR
jgi:hypothetical protein